MRSKWGIDVVWVQLQPRSILARVSELQGDNPTFVKVRVAAGQGDL